MNMNCLPNIFFNNQNEFRSVGTPTDRKIQKIYPRVYILLKLNVSTNQFTLQKL
jgi:hypothetical protein